MAKKRKAAARTAVTKGVTDAQWGSTSVTSAVSVEALRAMDKTLSHQDAFALSLDLRSAIAARNEPLSQGKVRIFSRRSGEEFTGGDLTDFFANPSPGMSQSAFINELGSWEDLAGEMVVGSIFADSKLPSGVYPLSPFRLFHQEPMMPRHLAQVKKWRYQWGDGINVVYGAESIILAKNFNPYSMVRGLSPVLSGVNEISAGYECMAYNRRFFSNNCEPSHIVNVPEFMSPEQVEAFKAEYLASHSIRAGNSHKVLFLVGAGVEVKPIGTGVMKDASFVNLQNLTSERIMRLYKVPPVHGGLWDKAKFDSVAEQNRVFAETVLLPRAERVSQFLQMIVDRWYRGSTNRRGDQKQLSKSMKDRLDKARAERVDSDVVVILDLDHLPIIAELKNLKLDFAQKLQQVAKVSPLEACTYVGIEVEKNDANTQVWHTSTEQVFAKPQEQAPATPPPEPQDDDEDDQTDPEPSEDEKQALSERRKALRGVEVAVRKLVLERAAEKKLARLKDLDALNATGCEALKRQFRLDLLAVKSILDDGGDAEAVKKYLNATYTRKFMKSL